jgi:hypothetical protein
MEQTGGAVSSTSKISTIEKRDIYCLFFLWCAERDLNPHDRNGQEILSLSCLPIPPSAQIFNIIGGTYGSRTHLKGFADLHVTVPSTRRLGYYNRSIAVYD